MKIVFFTNTLNNHQIGLSDELYKQNNGDYILVETQPLSEERRQMGFLEYERPYKIKSYESVEKMQKAFDIALNADVAIMGADSFNFLRARIQKGGMLTFSFSERWLKRGVISLLSPRLRQILRLYHFGGGKYEPWYVLAASAYLPVDYMKMRAFVGKCYKFGYFPIFVEHDIKSILALKRDSKVIKILWVARFLNLKHPEQMLLLASKLRDKGVVFEVNMVGTGERMLYIREEIDKHGLKDHVHLLGNKSNTEVLQLMREHHIFCFTSDKHEGWGAVLGEAMSNGCCTIASNSVGAAPFLIKDGENGYCFDLCKKNDLYSKVINLIENPELRERMAENAYSTMKNFWNPENAADKFIKLSESLLANVKLDVVKDGPCSIAKVIK